jgi:hypothetical protein
MRYSADIVAGSLKIAESRVIADLLIRGVDKTIWREAIEKQNVLQAKNPSTAIRIARLVRKRLELMKPDLWRIIRDGTGDVVTHAVLAAAVKHSYLLGDFMDLVVREQYKLFSDILPKRLWDEYLQDCRGRDPEMPEWKDVTRVKLGNVVYHILEQAGYLKDKQSLKLQAVHVATPVLSYLKDNDEQYVLRCILISP